MVSEGLRVTKSITVTTIMKADEILQQRSTTFLVERRQRSARKRLGNFFSSFSMLSFAELQDVSTRPETGVDLYEELVTKRYLPS